MFYRLLEDDNHAEEADTEHSESRQEHEDYVIDHQEAQHFEVSEGMYEKKEKKSLKRN